ncbi:hypothetical protein GIB67_006779 [Kingdonia uniflora]|uniref:DNA-directed DNA polymerase n=1 Tax=Kingdonia uniflora TaxID=39325 RepID=A0A7J7KZX0_9MAGN|nr:hypothetical protein GIB67_006779 [Kingdonia uniflora]
MKVPSGDVPYIIGYVISLNDNSIGNAHPNMIVYEQILNFLKVKAENYDGLFLSAVFIRMYSIDMVVKELVHSSDEIDSQIWDLLRSGLSGGIPQEVLTKVRGRKRSYKTYITAIKSSIKDRKSFIVANLETILINSIHKPYAAGYLVYYITYGGIYTIKPLMRNLRIYMLEVYKGEKKILIFRESLTLLPGSLAELAKTLCPHLGVVYKAQEIYWKKYGIGITSCLTLSSLAMKIYRSRYCNDKEFLIHILNKNEDKFFQTAYYGGHADMHKPYGKNIYYYDVNSLYPFIMKTYPMPCGKPVWNGNMQGVDLYVIYGFIQAYIITPKNIYKPFLLIRDKNGTLLFPKGKFIGVQSFHAKQRLVLRVVGVCDSKSLILVSDVFTKDLDNSLLLEICRLKNSSSSLATLFLICSETIGVLYRVVELGYCVVLANKKPLTSDMDDYEKLFLHPRHIRHESTVGADLPVITSINRLLVSRDTIASIIGSLSGTLGYVMSEVEDGKPFSKVVKAAKGLGYNKPDPRDDLSGMDVARKALILTRLLGWRINMDNIKVKSLYPQERVPNKMSLEDFMASGLPSLDIDIEKKTKLASINRNVLRYVCMIEGSSCQGGIKELLKDSPLGRLRGSNNVVEIYSRCYSELPLVIQGADAGNDTTAAGVQADILDLQDPFP